MKDTRFRRHLSAASLILATTLTFSSTCLAADAATLVFREGYVVRLNYGYKQLTEAFKALNEKPVGRQIMELAIEGGTFLIDLSEVVIVCRDQCASLELVDPRADHGKK